MAKEFDTLISDVLTLFEGADLSQTIQKFSDRLGVSLSEKFKRHGEERQPKLYLSNVGKPLRQLWYDLKGYKGEPISNTKKFSFLYGDILESIFMYLAEEAGHKVNSFQKRVEYDEVPGRIDGEIDDVLVDVKSCSPRSFEKFKSGKILTDDPFGYIPQLAGYWKVLKNSRAVFIAIEKVSGEICAFELTPEMRDSYDLSERIKTVREALKGDTPPERCYKPKPVSKDDKSGNLVLAIGCSYCAHKFECWKDSNDGKGLQLRHYSSGPKFFTSIVKEPRLKQKEEFITFPVKDETVG